MRQFLVYACVAGFVAAVIAAICFFVGPLLFNRPPSMTLVLGCGVAAVVFLAAASWYAEKAWGDAIEEVKYEPEMPVFEVCLGPKPEDN